VTTRREEERIDRLGAGPASLCVLISRLPYSHRIIFIDVH